MFIKLSRTCGAVDAEDDRWAAEAAAAAESLAVVDAAMHVRRRTRTAAE